MDGVNLQLPPTVNLSLAILGLMVIHNFMYDIYTHLLADLCRVLVGNFTAYGSYLT